MPIFNSNQKKEDYKKTKASPPLDILLSTLPNNMEELMGGASEYICPMEPLNLMYMASCLRDRGFAVGIMDAFALGYTEDELISEIRRLQPRIVGFSVVTSQASVFIKVAKKIKKEFPDIFLVIGNVHASIFHEYFLKNKLCDLVVHDEGERTISLVTEAVINKRPLEDIKGISYLTPEGKVVKTLPAPLIQNLDELPQPAWDLVYMEDYKMQFYVYPLAGRSRYFAQLITSRGCPFRCKFCSVHFNRQVRFMSGDRVIKDIKTLYYQYGVRFIMFHDSNFMFNRSRLMDICQRIIKEGIKISWGCEGRVDFVVNNPDILAVMKRAGCKIISYGIESGDQKVLDSCNKGTTLEQIKKAVKLTKKSGIRSFGLFILGLPEDNAYTCRKTIDFARSLPLDLAQFSIFVPFPGSVYFDELVEKQEIDEYNWDKFLQYHAFHESSELIYSPPAITPRELINFQKQAVFDFYMRPGIFLKMLLMFRPYNFRNYLESFLTLLGQLRR
jgi:magnesium-protoporphyrin IX monomethyl ester (oxidative) cyclase